MTLPIPTNTTCDVYRVGNTPPADPDVAGVAAALRANYAIGLERGEGDGAAKKFTHVLLVADCTDVRDDWDADTVGSNADTLYVPDQTGTGFLVVFVERVATDTALAHKRVFLTRQPPSWPTTQV